MRRIRIVLADDHVIVLDGLEQLFRLEPELEVVARSTTAEAAVKAVQEHRPDVLVLDLVMPGHDGMWVLRELSELNLPTRTVLLTAHVEENRLVEAIRLGVWGVVLKEMAPRMLMECVRKVHAGEKWLEQQSVTRAIERMRILRALRVSAAYSSVARGGRYFASVQAFHAASVSAAVGVPSTIRTRYWNVALCFAAIEKLSVSLPRVKSFKPNGFAANNP